MVRRHPDQSLFIGPFEEPMPILTVKRQASLAALRATSFVAAIASSSIAFAQREPATATCTAARLGFSC